MQPSKATKSFSLYEFFLQAGIGEKEALHYAENGEREKINTEELALQLDVEELKALGLVLGDRKRVINYIQSRSGTALVGSSSSSSSSLMGSPGVPSASPHARDTPPPQMRGDHTIEEKDLTFDQKAPIGSGHFGVVYRGTYKKGDVAIKILPEIESDDFWKEANTLVALTHRGHPNVLRFFGVCKLGAQMAIITEFMVHGSLKHYLNKYASTITPQQLFHFARSAAAGMLHLSSMVPPILHRDLAARNLLLGEADSEGRHALRVADFGLARASENGVYFATVKRRLPERCTAPEVWQKKGEHSIAADVYAFGVTLWEIFSLGLDPSWDNAIAPIELRTMLLPQRVHWHVPPLERVVPTGVHSLIQDCCQKDPSARPSWAGIVKRLEEEEATLRRATAPPTAPEDRASKGSDASYIFATPSSDAYVKASPSPSSPVFAGGSHPPAPLSHDSYALPHSFINVGGYGLPVVSGYSQMLAHPPPVLESRYSTPKPADEAWFWGADACAPQPPRVAAAAAASAAPPPAMTTQQARQALAGAYTTMAEQRQAAVDVLQQNLANLHLSCTTVFAPSPLTSSAPVYSTQPLPRNHTPPGRTAVQPSINQSQPKLRNSAPSSPLSSSNGAKELAVGFSDLPIGVLRTFETRVPMNLYSDQQRSQVVSAVPAHANLMEVLDSPWSNKQDWKHVTYGSIIGWVQGNVVEIHSSPRPRLIVYRSTNPSQPLVFYRPDQERLLTIMRCRQMNCRREYEFSLYIARNAYLPAECPYCFTRHTEIPHQLVVAAQELQERLPKTEKKSQAEPRRRFAEHPEHKLCFTSPGYPNGWRCNGCGSVGHAKTWHCSKCNFDLCTSCETRKGVPSCPGHHPCEWLENHNCMCDLCGRTIGNNAHWCCLLCDWCSCEEHAF